MMDSGWIEVWWWVLVLGLESVVLGLGLESMARFCSMTGFKLVGFSVGLNQCFLGGCGLLQAWVWWLG